MYSVLVPVFPLDSARSPCCSITYRSRAIQLCLELLHKLMVLLILPKFSILDSKVELEIPNLLGHFRVLQLLLETSD